MKIENNIGWTDETTNAVTGCDKVSPGCKNCYAASGTRARVLRHQGIETWGPKGVRHPVAEFAKKIRRLNKLCVCGSCATGQPFERLVMNLHCKSCGRGDLRRIRLFADSNSDWLDPKWSAETLASFLKEIHDAPNVDIQLLTKRPENYFGRIEDAVNWLANDDQGNADAANAWSDPDEQHITPPNVWIGVSVENQEMADKRIPELLRIPAAIRFLSCEPLLEKVFIRPVAFSELQFTENEPAIHWVIVGAESGPNRREVPVEAILNVADQCKAAGVPCFVKQDGALTSGQQGRIPDAYWSRKEMPL